MLRASAVVERAGIPTASLVCEGFLKQAAMTKKASDFPNLPVAQVPGHVSVQSDDELRNNVLGVTVDDVIENLCGAMEIAAEGDKDYQTREIAVSGTLEEIDRFFYEREWSDGLPFVPPTIERVEQFLRYTDLDPDHSFGVMLPGNRSATVWSVAVNGVMAGCLPEYMPILIAIVEVLTDPAYGVEHSGNTPGSEPLIILNGPIIKELGFNYTQGVLRDGFRPNTSVGRFLRLYSRNIVGFLPHKTDKGTFGNTWRVVLAENEDVLRQIGWEPMSSDAGFARGENAVTLVRFTGGNVIAAVVGTTPETILPYIADAVVNQNTWQLLFTAGLALGRLRPMVIFSPILAETIARAGWSRDDVRQYLFEHCRMPAHKFENYVGQFSGRFLPHRASLVEMAELGEVPPVFNASGDPERMVPIVFEPDNFLIAVSGDPLRTNAYTFSHNGFMGFPTAKRVRLPKAWDSLPKST